MMFMEIDFEVFSLIIVEFIISGIVDSDVNDVEYLLVLLFD